MCPKSPAPCSVRCPGCCQPAPSPAFPQSRSVSPQCSVPICAPCCVSCPTGCSPWRRSAFRQTWRLLCTSRRPGSPAPAGPQTGWSCSGRCQSQGLPPRIRCPHRFRCRCRCCCHSPYAGCQSPWLPAGPFWLLRPLSWRPRRSRLPRLLACYKPPRSSVPRLCLCQTGRP